MKVILVLVLTFVELPFVISQEFPCHLELSVDITNGNVSKSGEIVYENVTYPKQLYFELEVNKTKQLRGCLCNVTNCVRKCCPFGYGYSYYDNQCVKINRTEAVNFTVPVYEDKSFIQQKSFKYVVNRDCLYEGYVLDPKAYPNDKNYVQNSGELFMPNNKRTLRSYEEYCVDLNATANLLEYITLLCFDPPELNPQDLYKYGMLISMPFLLVTLLVYLSVPELQNIHGKCLICYVISLLTAYVFLVCVQLDTSNTNTPFCLVTPFIIYFAFMVSFMWLHVMCIDIWWTFSGLRGYKGSAKKSEQKRFLLYSLYAWGVPLLMLGVTLTLQFVPNLPDWVVTPQIAVTKCWFPDDKVVGYYFYGPILAIISVNLALFTYTTWKIWMVQRNTDQSMKNGSQRHNTSDSDKQRYKLYLKLMFVFGVNWLMEIVSWLADGPQWLWYVTDMCNALYGVFIFFIFVCKANVWKLVRKRYDKILFRGLLDKKQQQMTQSELQPPTGGTT